MNGLCRRFSACRAFCRAISIVLGIAIILASSFPASPIHVEHFVGSDAQVIAVNDHAVPADKKVQDHKTHASCNPGVGCFAFTVPAEEASMLNPFGITIERAEIAKLVTRIVAPPLPPPKIIILV